MSNKTLHVSLGNQLFPIKYLKNHKIKNVFMREDMQLCTYEKHHKHKIILFLSAMRSYRDLLKKNNINVHYEELKPIDSEVYIDSLIKYIKKNKITDISIFSVEDNWFEKKIK